ncbi:unnamed protein product [Rotaria sp. Silwood1]|nr:unnamed protein product [Rotaria sp. Silwood1]
MNEDMYIQLSFYSQPIIILVGTVGSLLNQIIFHRRKSLRTASCSLYFRSLSINDLLVLYIIVLTQWLNDQFHFDLTIKYLWYCKIQTYIMHCLYAVSPYFLVLGCFDRLCRTSRNIQLRQMATLNMARQITSIPVQYMYRTCARDEADDNEITRASHCGLLKLDWIDKSQTSDLPNF